MVSQTRLAIALVFVMCGVAGCIEQETPISVLPMTTNIPSSSIQIPSATPLIQDIIPVGSLPAEAGTSLAVGGDPAPLVQKATEDLAKTLSISTSSVTLVDIPLPVQWNDSSLGCPQQGQTYVPAMTPGYLFTLAAGGSTYEVHTDLNNVVFCLNPNESLGTITAPDPIAAEFITGAKKDLASRLNVSIENIVLVRSEAVEWSDEGLGCPEPGKEYVQALTPGYRIVLAVEETYYEYHTDYQRMVLCPLPTPTP